MQSNPYEQRSEWTSQFAITESLKTNKKQILEKTKLILSEYLKAHINFPEIKTLLMAIEKAENKKEITDQVQFVLSILEKKNTKNCKCSCSCDCKCAQCFDNTVAQNAQIIFKIGNGNAFFGGKSLDCNPFAWILFITPALLACFVCCPIIGIRQWHRSCSKINDNGVQSENVKLTEVINLLENIKRRLQTQ